MTKKNHREKLRRLAKAATPGPWVADGLEGTLDSLSTGRRVAEVTMWPEVDAEFIAAANPATVLGLLDRLAHMTEARDNARAEVERLAGQVEVACSIIDDARHAAAGERTKLGLTLNPILFGEDASRLIRERDSRRKRAADNTPAHVRIHTNNQRRAAS